MRILLRIISVFLFSIMMSLFCSLGRAATSPSNDIQWTDVSYLGESGLTKDEAVSQALDFAEVKYNNSQQVYIYTALPGEEVPSAPEREWVVDSTRTIPTISYDDHLDDYASQDVMAIKPSKPPLVQLKVSAEQGVRVDELRWHIAGNIFGDGEGIPNILSELTWYDLYMQQTRVSAELAVDQRFILEATAAYSDIYSGKNQDSDYDEDDRMAEYSRSVNSADDGEALDFWYALGYRFHMAKPDNQLAVDDAWLTFLLGYSQHEQHLEINDGNQVIDTDFGVLGPFAGLDSRYDTEWKGPFVGVEVAGEKGKVFGKFRYEYHEKDYYASADWNLRNDFNHPVSFDHQGEGKGNVYRVETGYNLTDDWQLSVAADMQAWRIRDGIDTAYLADNTVERTRLNVVDWDTYSLMAGMKYTFF